MGQKTKSKRTADTLLEELVSQGKARAETEEHILNALKKLTRMFELGVKISGGIIPMNEVENALNRIDGRYRQAETEAKAQTQQSEESGQTE